MSRNLPVPDISRFVHDRFGMFIHWGPGALHDGEVSWARIRGPGSPILDAAYQRYVDHFDPDLYDPDAWIAAAKRAGMRYAVLTTKHHDGFCLWDTALSEFKATNTPAGRDLVGPFVEACRRHGLRIGFYYSLIDWNHPHFTIDFLHPMRHDPAVAAQRRDMRIYAEYMRGQVRELLTRYGAIDYLWFDFSYNEPERARTAGWQVEHWVGKGKDDWESDRLLALVRELQPAALVNDRLGIPGDVMTPEQYQPAKLPQRDGRPVPWEACMTMNNTWAYNRDDRDWKSPDMLLRSLIESVSMGGNLLLNVGPTGRGLLDDATSSRLAAIGDWMRVNGRAIHGCGRSAFTPPEGCRFTQRGDRLYVHVLTWPRRYLRLEALGGRVDYAQFLCDASEVKRAKVFHMMLQGDRWSDDTLMLDLPIQPPGPIPVIELFLKGEPS
ncbi:MAG: alpha-L-fucosidase [Alphaproteobacteria bacterium]|nr:alpha-L-fucosidase [Alphaproteobacteria bacterium]